MSSQLAADHGVLARDRFGRLGQHAVRLTGGTGRANGRRTAEGGGRLSADGTSRFSGAVLAKNTPANTHVSSKPEEPYSHPAIEFVPPASERAEQLGRKPQHALRALNLRKADVVTPATRCSHCMLRTSSLWTECAGEDGSIGIA